MSSVLRSYKNVQPTTVYNNGQVGDMKMSAAIIDHGGWLLCNGRALDVREYYMLFKMIGYSFGHADNYNKFLLPFPDGRVPGFKGQATTNDPNPPNPTWVMGDVSGAYTHTLTIPQLPKHNHNADETVNETTGLVDASGGHAHDASDAGHAHAFTIRDGNQSVFPGTATAANETTSTQTTGTGYADITVDPVDDHQHTIYSRGENQPHNNVQPTLFVGNMFIYTGVNKYYVENS